MVGGTEKSPCFIQSLFPVRGATTSQTTARRRTTACASRPDRPKLSTASTWGRGWCVTGSPWCTRRCVPATGTSTPASATPWWQSSNWPIPRPRKSARNWVAKSQQPTPSKRMLVYAKITSV